MESIKNEIIVISMGGSIIYPSEKGINHALLDEYKKFFEKEIIEGKKFIIVTGGGFLAREYQDKAKEKGINDNHSLDIEGIKATHENAKTIYNLLKEHTNSSIIKSAQDNIDFKKPILISGGWTPGNSTDLIAINLAEKYGAKKIINLTNIEKVYTADPKKDPNAKPLDRISWKDFRKLVGDKWSPGMNAPFDPIASKKAEKLGVEVFILNGKNISNLKNLLENKPFIGTTIK
jgi:uridylate kinase